MNDNVVVWVVAYFNLVLLGLPWRPLDAAVFVDDCVGLVLGVFLFVFFGAD